MAALDRPIPLPAVVKGGGRAGLAAGVLLGGALGVVSLIVPHFLSDEVVIDFFGVMLGMVGAVYLGFALSDGRAKWLTVEQFGILGFGILATVAIANDAPMLLVGGFVGHALWDVLHPHPVGTAMPRWYVPACIGWDLVVGAYLFIRFI